MLRRLQRSASHPAGSEKDPEGHERAGTERDQLRVAAPPHQRQRDHHRGKDQHQEVIERVRPIEEADGHTPRFCVGGGS
jgi:hypothetical protein